eukprot:TRINITY_DN59689_c0_g1_i1.p1 TRINITY_DN59689_c0_g1~~TRINITY_DN59689_c0_g1_i1.p1  ORF type:complete len:252 (+),score=53.59 TRINITY_DN59689_c0_g1_i1:68-823(+)
MPHEVRVQKALSHGPEFPLIDSAVEAQLTLQGPGFVFLDGKKLKPLKTADARSTIKDLDACIAWPGGPWMRLRFPDQASLEPLKAALEQAQRRAKTEVSTTPPRLVHPLESPSKSVIIGNKRPAVRELATPAKRLATASARKATSSRHVGSDLEESSTKPEEEPPAPRVDLALSEEDRLQRRVKAAQQAQTRAEEALSRGIGDPTAAQRMQLRAERDELVGRIKAQYSLQGKDVPWNLGTATVQEMHALLR